MCLSIPAQLLEIHESQGIADCDGTRIPVDLSLTPEAKVGDWVLVHAGCAIQIYDEAEAQETLRLLRELHENLEAV